MLELDTDFDPVPGRLDRLTDRVARVVADNPGPFTFRGTGVYIVGTDPVAVIDPGPVDEVHLEALLTAVSGRTVSHILITHTHRDHSPGAAGLQAATGAPTFGFGPHPAAARREPSTAEDTTEESGDLSFIPDVVVQDGDVIEGDGWTIEALHTPGHISNHLCYALREERSVFTGDHIMGWSTTVIPPPDGDMAAYIRNLERFVHREESCHWPTHGPPILDPVAHARALIDHRLERERQIIEQVDSGASTIPLIVEALYPGIGENLTRAAGQSVLAHLIALVEAGRVGCDGEPGVEAVYLSRSRARRGGSG